MITNIELDIKRKDVYNEVARISGYVGAKSFKEQDGQADTYSRIAITDSDSELLDRYWEDCCGKVAGELQRFIKDIVSNDKSNDATFIIQPLSDVAQRKTVLQKDLFSCFVNFILCKWFELTDKERCEYYFANYNDFIKGIRRKLCMKFAPTKANFE
ncbi:hypothetical protein [Prevotella pallens]|jgi:hypothetical protein|uniref:hypothetical protein n=1 Tax=Prevotella pallens TaxID=60133 RepID=UPI0028895F18|nr:hypothetical protein [Prevotella pallens]